jgi:membrane protein DedA with SNARE-associated domain
MVSRGVIVLFLVTLIQAAGVPFPIPSGLLLMDAAGRNRASLSASLFVLTVATLATLLGALALYALTRRAGPAVIDKYGKMQAWMNRRGEVALVLGRVIPGMAVPTIVVAGTLGVTWIRYALCTVVGALAWAALYYYLGLAVGDHTARAAARLAEAFDLIPDWILIVSGALLLVVSAGEVWRRRHPTSFESTTPS